MAERQKFIDRVKGAERECYVVTAAVAYYTTAISAGETPLTSGTTPRDLDSAADRVEATYIVRMWAEFETAPRSYHSSRHRVLVNPNDQIRAINLIEWTAGIKQRRAISADVTDRVHEVRVYRNFLVHQRDDGAPPVPVTIEEARRRLNTLLHCLPIRW